MKRPAKASNGQTPAAARPRLQIPATDLQRGACEQAAARAGSDVNTWALAHLMRAATKQDAAGSPVVITGEVADRLRQLASDQGIDPDRALKQLLISGGS